MHQHNNSVITLFTSDKNVEHLRRSILYKYNDNKVAAYLDKYLHDHIVTTAHSINRELLNSDPIVNLSKRDHVTFFNNRFLVNECKFIDTYIFHKDDNPDQFTYSESKNGKICDQYSRLPSAQLLSNWQNNPGKLRQFREDPMGHAIESKLAITYCDTDNLNTQNHYSVYESNLYKVILNDGQHDPFGVSKNDARLLSRRIFRDGAHGENTIPFYEKALYVRNYERDISDTLPSYEKDYINRKHDMNDIKKSQSNLANLRH